MEAFGADPDGVGVLGMGRDVGVVERTRDELGVVAGERKRLAGVGGAIEAVARLRFHQDPDNVGVGGRDGDVALADELIGQAVGELLPRASAISGLVDAALTRARDDGPRLALGAPHGGIERARIAGLEFDVHRTRGIRNEEDALPRLSAVGGAIEAALVGGLERVADGGDEGDVGIGRMNANAADVGDGC